MGLRRTNEMPWLVLFANHAVMLVIALALIAGMTRGRHSECGLQWPKQKGHVRPARPPDGLDFLAICLEAGLGLDQGIVRLGPRR